MKFPSIEFDDAVSALCHGTIGDAELAELHELLLESIDARDAYLWRVEIHGELAAGSLEFLHSSSVEEPCNDQITLESTASESVRHPIVEVGDSGKADLTAPIFQDFGRQSGRTWKVAMQSIAAMVMVAFGSVWIANRFLQHDQEAAGVEELVNSTDEPSGAAVTDPFLAIVIDQSADAQWGGTRAPRGMGYAVGRDRIVLDSGEATMQLDNGVELKMRAPAELTFLSVDHAVLHQGYVSARVPKDAIGFRLDGPGLNVVDLGTEFSLAVGDSGSPQVHVFDGKVRAALPTVPSSRTELNTGETASFDVARGLVTRSSNVLSDDGMNQFPRLDGQQGLPTTSGNVFFLRRPPPSVRTGTYEHDSILVFREKEYVALPKSVQVVRRVTNQYNSKQPSVPEYAQLEAGALVQSYLIHFDRVGDSWTGGMTARGMIRFDKPILGFIVEPRPLARTDEYCCHPETTYEHDVTRPLEMRYFSDLPDCHDEVYLSEDGCALDLTLRAGPYADQFRVFVAVE